MAFKRLPRSIKGAHPFRTAAPSFVYPADYVPNARMLAPCVDEIELLFFESRALPSPSVIAELAAIGAAEDLGYHVHLPTDVTIGAAAPIHQAATMDALCRAVERAAPLNPSTFTLHVSPESDEPLGPWRARVRRDLAHLAAAIGEPARISLETLDDPLEQIGDLIPDLGLSVCMDVGHLLLHGHDPAACAARFATALKVIHLHAATGGRDHLALDRLAEPAAGRVLGLLATFRGIVSLEVFSYEALAASIEWLEGAGLPASH
jgi:sugar phosphate isomerase/epimerase